MPAIIEGNTTPDSKLTMCNSNVEIGGQRQARQRNKRGASLSRNSWAVPLPVRITDHAVICVACCSRVMCHPLDLGGGSHARRPIRCCSYSKRRTRNRLRMYVVRSILYAGSVGSTRSRVVVPHPVKTWYSSRVLQSLRNFFACLPRSSPKICLIVLCV